MIFAEVAAVVQGLPITPDHTVTIDWLDWLKVTGSCAVIITAAIFVFQPFFDRLILGAWRRLRSEVRLTLDEMYKERFERMDHAVEASEANADAIEFIRAAVLQQGKILPTVSEGLTRMTAAVETLSDVVDRLDRRSEATSGVATHVAAQVELLLVERGLPVTRPAEERRDPEHDGGRRIADKLNPVPAIIAEVEKPI